MNGSLKKVLALTMALALMLGLVATAEVQSAVFTLNVQPKPTTVCPDAPSFGEGELPGLDLGLDELPEAPVEEPSLPVETLAPVETEAPAETEAPVETETPAETEAPAETAEPTQEPAPTAHPDEGETPDAFLFAEEEPIEEPVEEEAPMRVVMPLLKAGETFIPLYAEPNADSQILAEIDASQMLLLKELGETWSQVVFQETTGYVPTDSIVLYNGETAPEEEEKIRTIFVSTSAAGSEVVHEGDVITLTATLIGFENDLYALQWQYTPDGGLTVLDADGANELTYSYVVSAENAAYLWRVQVMLLNDIDGALDAQ